MDIHIAHEATDYRHSYNIHMVLGTAGGIFGRVGGQQGECSSGMDLPAISAPTCYRCCVGGGARERRHLHRRFAAAPLDHPLLVQQRSLGLQVAQAAARYLDQTQAEPLLAASEALDVRGFSQAAPCS